MSKPSVTLLVVIVLLTAMAVINMKTSWEVWGNTEQLNLVVDDLKLKEAKIKFLKERLEFQNKLVVPMWLYFEQWVPRKPSPTQGHMLIDLHRREAK